MPARIPLMVLIVHVPGGADRRIEITDWRTVIGRSSKNDIKIVAKQVSKIHAAIEVTDGVPYIRDLGSRNGVELNGQTISRPEQLRAGDILVLGEARISVDPQSVLFRPHDAQVALQALLEQEAVLRAQEASQYEAQGTPHTVNESFQPTRQSPHLIGRPLGNAVGDSPILRTLRLVGDRGPRDVARIEAFLLELHNGEVVLIRPHRDVSVARLAEFPPASNVWIDEPEDFGGPGAHSMVVARGTHFLPPMIEVLGTVEVGRSQDGRRVFGEGASNATLVIAPAPRS